MQSNRLLVFVVILSIIGVCALYNFIAHQYATRPSNIKATIRVGMTKEQVKGHLGRPDNTHTFLTRQRGVTVSVTESWMYGDSTVSLKDGVVTAIHTPGEPVKTPEGNAETAGH